MNASVNALPPVTVNLPAFVPFMTREKFSELTGLTPRTIDSMVQRGYLPAFRPSCGDNSAKRSLINLVVLIKECQEG